MELLRAVLAGSFKETRELIERGKNVNWKHKKTGEFALYGASKNGHTEVARLLLQSGAQVEQQNNNGWSSLIIASWNGHTEVAKLLLQNGAQVDSQRNNGWSPLMMASQNGHTEVVRLLLQNGAEVDLQESKGGSSLMIASWNGHVEVVHLLLQNGARVDLQRNNGWSPLMIASWNGYTEVASLLLQNGAQVDLRHNRGETALMTASWNGRTEVASLLLQNGAQVDLQNNNGQSPLTIAIKKKYTELIELFQNPDLHVIRKHHNEATSAKFQLECDFKDEKAAVIVNQLQQKDDQLAKQKKESDEECLQQLTAQNEEMRAQIKNLEDQRIKGAQESTDSPLSLAEQLSYQLQVSSPSPSTSAPNDSVSVPADMNTVPVLNSCEFKIELKEGWEVRKYQRELAEPGINGENYIIIAPTGSGKTLVSALVTADHLQKKQDTKLCHVMFIVNTRPLAEQQKKELKGLIPSARVAVCTGNEGSVADSMKNDNHITVCTAGKLLDELKKGQVKMSKISLMIFDECHHTSKGHPYARLMEHYLKRKEKRKTLPQVIGMTASPGAGDNDDLDTVKTINHLVSLASPLDASGGFKRVTENLDELQASMKNSSFTQSILRLRIADDPVISLVTAGMEKLEKQIADHFKCIFDKWSQKYETMIQQSKHPLELSKNENFRDAISTLSMLRCYSCALSVYMDLRKEDAMKVIENYEGLPEDDSKATPHEREMKIVREDLLEKLRAITPGKNPLLERIAKILIDTFENSSDSKGILFVRTKNHAHAMHDWVSEHPKFKKMIKSGIITGHTRQTGMGMTQDDQHQVMAEFHKGDINLLIATSVAEEGLDVPKCNLVIRFQHVSNDIAKVQTEGRARAENSEGYTILSSDSNSKQLRELKNMDLIFVVQKIFENDWFPTGEHLKAELKERQQQMLRNLKLKAALKKTRRLDYSADQVKLLCRKCKVPACLGSDIYRLTDGDSSHYVVPCEKFKEEKIQIKPHHKPCFLVEGKVVKTKKIYCNKCERDWGIMCIWPAEGCEFPILKCVNFTFDVEGRPCFYKKWSDVPFETNLLSDWFRESKSKFASADSDDDDDDEDDDDNYDDDDDDM